MKSNFLRFFVLETCKRELINDIFGLLWFLNHLNCLLLSQSQLSCSWIVIKFKSSINPFKIDIMERFWTQTLSRDSGEYGKILCLF